MLVIVRDFFFFFFFFWKCLAPLSPYVTPGAGFPCPATGPTYGMEP